MTDQIEEIVNALFQDLMSRQGGDHLVEGTDPDTLKEWKDTWYKIINEGLK